MTETENKPESSPQPSLPSPVMTDSELDTKEVVTVTTTVEETTTIPDLDNKDQDETSSPAPAAAAAVLAAAEEQDEFSDAVDEMNIKTAQDLSNVISELQGTVIANLPSGEEKIVIHQEEEQMKQLEPNDVLDTIPEDDFGSSLINKEENEVESPIKQVEQVEEGGGAEDKADIDIPLDITAASEPSSPRPNHSKATDLQIATHFEQIRQSIDLPAGQNMADFVTPPTPGVAPPSMMHLPCADDENDDDLKLTKTEGEEEEGKGGEEDIATAAVDVATAAVAAGEEQVKPSTTNAITLANINFDAVKPNFLTPRAQEKFGELEIVCQAEKIFY